MILTSQQEQELRQNPLFETLSVDQLQELQQGLSLRRLEAGEHLFEAGSKAEAFYMVRRGQLKLYRLSPTGQEKVIEIVRPGQTFAEALMFLEIPAYPVNAQALSETEVYAIRNSAFLGLLSQSVATCFPLLGGLSVRLKQLLNEIDSLTLQNATLRMTNYLLFLLPESSRDGVEITLPAAKNIVASRLSITPETLSRILNTLSAKGLISVEGLHITVHDVERLRACSH